jgi:predicted DNA-binding transcriptional regulator YafY
MKLLELLHSRPGLEAAALATACGTSTRTLQRDLDALGAAGFPVYFERGYRLAAPTLLPAVTLTVDQALALRMAAASTAARAELVTARALSVASQKLEQAMVAQPPEDQVERQLALPVQDAQVEASTTALTKAIAEQRTVRVTLAAAPGRLSASRRVDPYRLLPATGGLELLGYSHERRRILRLPVTRLREVSLLQRRFRPLPARLVERHLHHVQASAPELHWVRMLCRPPLVERLRTHPPVGSLMWEDGPDGSVIYTLATRRAAELVPWLLSCGDAVEVLKPHDLRQEVWRIARAMAERYTAATRSVGPTGT